MPRYRRRYQAGACWFFTSNLADRHSHALVTHIHLLKHAVRLAHRAMPFSIVAWVVLPNHMHTIWQLPPGDTNYPARWQLLKKRFSRDLRLTSQLSCVPNEPVWQRGYWEHLIRDDSDLRNHIDYVHRNPQKHHFVKHVRDWPHSTFHRYVRAGVYDINWCG